MKLHKYVTYLLTLTLTHLLKAPGPTRSITFKTCIHTLRFLSRCLRIDTAFLIRQYRSSGIFGANPWALRMRRILLPVTWRTWATPWESRRMTPEPDKTAQQVMTPASSRYWCHCNQRSVQTTPRHGLRYWCHCNQWSVQTTQWHGLIHCTPYCLQWQQMCSCNDNVANSNNHWYCRNLCKNGNICNNVVTQTNKYCLQISLT